MAAKARYVLVYFTWRGTPKVKELEPLFNTSLDWLRLAGDFWILWTTQPPSYWYPYVKKQMGQQDSVLICELNTTTEMGWQPQWILDWLQKPR